MLLNKHKGARILVKGGGPSLEDDLLDIDCDIVISTNGHGFLFKDDYLLAMDEKHGGKGVMMIDYLKTLSDKPIIGPQKMADYRLRQWPKHPRRLYSGNIAVWIASKMGANEVIVAGVDGYNCSPNYMRQIKFIEPELTCSVYSVSGSVFPMYIPSEDDDDTDEG